MRIEVTVKRRSGPEATAYMQTFIYEGDGKITVADWLTEINRTQAKTDRISWECGCMEKKCGACAMVVNGVAGLACGVFLKDTGKDGKILLEPLSKFPVVKDLAVDRSSMFRMLTDMKIWTEEKDQSSAGQDYSLQYKASRCLQCGCCLEVCPNFPAFGKFAGAAAMTAAYKSMEQNVRDDHLKEMKEAYRLRFYSGCGQSLSCRDICPMKLPLDEIQAGANRRGR